MLPSIAQYQYPDIVLVDGNRLLWNPILKKTFKQRPEERVRLQLLDYLMQTPGCVKSRTAFETPVKLRDDKTSSRTDLICYDKSLDTLLLVECKAPEIRLNENTAVQIARYNQKIEARYLLITNGVIDYWFKFENDAMKSLNEIPDIFTIQNNNITDYNYWVQKGFAGNKPVGGLKEWIQNSCHWLFKESDFKQIQFFSFDGSDPALALSNYYYIYSLNKKQKFAVTLSAAPDQSTKLTIIYNHEGQNEGFLSCTLDEIENPAENDTLIIVGNNNKSIKLNERIGFNFSMHIEEILTRIMELFLTNKIFE